MDGRIIEIDGETFDLADPEDKKRAIRAWLKAKSRKQHLMDSDGGDAGGSGDDAEGKNPHPREGNGT